MSILLTVIIGLVLIILLISFIWRGAAHHRALPCPAWLGWLVELENPILKVYQTREIIKHLQLQQGMKVLDIGCGPGRVSLAAAVAVGPQGEVTAVDIQPGMLRKAQQKAEAAGATNIRFLQAGAGEGKLGIGGYDRALLVTVLGEIPDRETALREVFGALKPGGILSITEIIMDPHFQGRKTVIRLAGMPGFREKAFFGHRFAYTINLEKPE